VAAFVIPPTAAQSRPVPWLVTLAAVVVADIVIVSVQASLDWVGVLCIAFLAVALWQRRSLAWNLAIAVLGIGLIPLRVADVIQLATSPYYSGSIGLDYFVPLGFTAAGLVALVTGASAVRAWRHLRRLPGEPPTEAQSPGLPTP
jgi:hypothetical protein